MSFLKVAAPLISGFLGYKGAQSQAQQQQAQNALLKEQYEQQKLERAPIVAGAKELVENQAQFRPFVDAAGQQSVAGSNIASQYLANVPHYQAAGLQGLGLTQQLAGFTPFQQQQLQDQYAQGDIATQYNLAARDINRQADLGRKEQAISGGRFGALSGQQARAQGEIERQRQEGINQAAAQASQQAYQRAQQELARQTGLAGTLGAYGTSGLSQAQQAAQLGSGAQQYGIQAPFLPFQQYAQTLGQAPSVSVPKYGTVTDPFTTGAGLGLQAYSLFNRK